MYAWVRSCETSWLSFVDSSCVVSLLLWVQGCTFGIFVASHLLLALPKTSNNLSALSWCLLCLQSYAEHTLHVWVVLCIVQAWVCVYDNIVLLLSYQVGYNSSWFVCVVLHVHKISITFMVMTIPLTVRSSEKMSVAHASPFLLVEYSN